MKVLNKKLKSFTLLELIVVISVVWMLMMATTVYLWWTDEKRKVIEAQWCTATIWSEITNFVFYALTSKNLKLENDTYVSPDYYYVSLTWWSAHGCAWQQCKIVLSYSTWSNNMRTYKILSSSNNCRWTKTRLIYSWWTVNYVKMNKWFSISADDPSKNQVFDLNWSSAQTWDIIISLCINESCTSPKEISKFVVDWRSQTISAKNCKYYQDNDPTKCKTREECQIYDPNDSSVCLKY
jgi:hypothetical protein